MEEYSRKMASGVQMQVPDQLLGHGLEVAMRQRKQTQPRCQDQHAFSALDQRHHPQSCFSRGIGHGFALSSRFRRLYRPTLLGNDLRPANRLAQTVWQFENGSEGLNLSRPLARSRPCQCRAIMKRAVEFTVRGPWPGFCFHGVINVVADQMQLWRRFCWFS